MAASMRAIGKSSLTIFQDVGLLAKHQTSPLYNVIPVMYMRNKHYNPKFRKARMYKDFYVNKMEMYENTNDFPGPKFEETKDKRFRESRGADRPDRHYTTRQPTPLDSAGVLDYYVPPEGDGKVSILQKEGIKQEAQRLARKASARLRAVRKIRKNGEANFNAKDVAPELLQIYIDAHNLLNDFKKNKRLLQDIVTTNCFSKMAYNLDRMTLRWEFVENIEPPRSVHVSCADGYTKDVFYAQVTLRIHSKQKLAMYDQFGRLIFGDANTARDTLEFIVFEKNIVDLYGRWKMVDKAQPDWLPKPFKLPTFYTSSEKPKKSKDVDAKDSSGWSDDVKKSDRSKA